MLVSEDSTPLDAADAWLCHHVDADNAPSTPTRLTLIDTHDWPHPVQNARRWVNCPDCGTRWRVWVQSRQVKPTVHWHGRISRPGAYRFRHAPLLDIDRLVERIRQGEPLVRVDQFENVWPADDDGLWYFALPGGSRLSVQVESPSGNCPFLVERTGCQTVETVEEAANLVFAALRRSGSAT